MPPRAPQRRPKRDPHAATAHGHPRTAPVVASLNLAISLVWSALLLVPVMYFCDQYLDRTRLSLLLAPSLAAFALPTSALRLLQLSPHLRSYRRLRVPLLNHLTQDAPWIRRLARGSAPTRLLLSPASLTRIERATYLRERFHLACLVFLLLLTLVAAVLRRPSWVALFLLANLAFNLYPIWLQQYLRLRLEGLRSRHR